MPIDISKISSSILGAGNKKTDTTNNSVTSPITEKRNENHSSSTNFNFSKGQVFRGQITNISPKEITIELENGETLNARYENASDLSIGDGAKFKVLSNVDNKLEIKALLHSGEGIDSAVYKALEASGLPFSEKNEELITSLLKNELPVNKQMINQILQQSLKNTEISISNLVLMNKAGLPINSTITSMFEQFYNGSMDFSKNVENQFQYMLEMIEGLISEGREDTAVGLTKEFLDTLNLGLEPDFFVQSNLSSATSSSSTIDSLNEFNTLLKNNFIENPHKIDVESSYDKTKNVLQNPETTLATFFSEEELLQIFTAFENADVDAVMIQKLISGKLNLEELSQLIDKLSESEANDKTLFPEVLKNLSTELLNDSDAKFIGELLPAESSLSEAANLMKNLLQSDSLSLSQKIALLKSPELKTTLEMLIKTDLTLSPEELLRESAVNEYYNRANQLLEKMSNLSFKNTDMGGKFSENTTAMKEQLHFLNTLSPYYSFVELPLRLQGQTTKGELYVYTNKKKKMNNGSISCLLHLDMENLGEMNVRIELNGDAVSTKFYLDDDESGKLISANLSELDKAVNRQGYQPESEVVKISKKKEKTEIEKGRYNLVKDFIPSEVKKNNFTRYTFDVRA